MVLVLVQHLGLSDSQNQGGSLCLYLYLGIHQDGPIGLSVSLGDS